VADRYDSMSYQELKSEAAARELGGSGDRGELLAKLRADDAAQATPAAPAVAEAVPLAEVESAVPEPVGEIPPVPAEAPAPAEQPPEGKHAVWGVHPGPHVYHDADDLQARLDAAAGNPARPVDLGDVPPVGGQQG
jgi:hypothetical protein